MKCPRCQHANPSGVKFCGECGARLELQCPSCHTANPPTNKFCNDCGAPLAQVGTATKFFSPDSYTPKHLAEKILTSKSALEGERKQVTVLFADMKGSMELLADRDPEDARKLLDPILEHMMEAVHGYEGTVNQVMGDGIMALFGAPLAHEDHAVRACYAALRMQESVKRYSEGVRRTEGIPIQVRVGLNSGEVVVRSIGSDLKMDYTAVGQTTHLAARMEQMATPGSVLMTPEALRLAEGFVQVKPLGPVTVKGLTEPLEVYEVNGVGATRSRLQAAAARGFTRFVGRDKEIEQLRTALERASSSHGQVVAVVGEPGLGKSRLFHEFTHSHRTQDWLIVESGSVSYGKATPYLPLIDLLKAYFKIHDRDNQREIREKITGKLLTLDESLKPTLPVFLALLDISVEDPQWQVLDPPQKRQRTLDACKRLLFRESQAQPLLLVFEDLHWIDAETQTLLDSLVESLPTARLLLLVNYRPEYQHGWGSKTFYSQLRLDPLPTENAEELLHSLLGNDPSLHALKQLLIARTEGNPFFLEESVRTLVETKALEGERGAYRVAKSVENIQVPATVQAVLAARIDRLPAENKRLLQSAAVIGKDVPFVLLRTIADLSEDDLRRGLAHLQTGEFLYETSLFPELEYTFKHALTHEVAYGSLLQERRRALHGRIVEAIEKLYSDRLAEQAELLAHHAFRGELWEKAVTYLRQAGVKAAGRSADREAVSFFDQALSVLKHLPQNRGALELAVDLGLEMRPWLRMLGEQERVVEQFSEAESLAEELGDKRRLAHVFADSCAYFSQEGDHQRAINAGERALVLAIEMGDSAIQIGTQVRLARVYVRLGDYRRAIDLCEQNLSSLKGRPVGERNPFGMQAIVSVATRSQRAVCHGEIGELAQGIGWAQEAVRIAETLDHSHSLLAAYSALSYVYLVKGDLENALTLLDRGLQICRTAHLDIWLSWPQAQLGYAYIHLSRSAEALPLLEEAAKRPSLGVGIGFHLCWLSEAYLQAGRLDDAIAVVQRALDRAQKSMERAQEAWALRLLGEISSQVAVPEVDKAEEHYRRALTLAVELGMRPLMAHCHVGLGKLYRRIGSRQQAEEHLATATTMMRDMEMGLWLEKAEMELKELA
jgi:class 3 adenylate cyclase/tetratricopeptide (TPR) repeat protein